MSLPTAGCEKTSQPQPTPRGKASTGGDRDGAVRDRPVADAAPVVTGPEPIAIPDPVDPAALPELTVPARKVGPGPEFTLYAADADAQILYLRLVDSRETIFTRSVAGHLVTGRATGTAGQILAGLVSARPELAPLTEPPRLSWKHGSRNVDLNFADAEPRGLFRLFSDVLAANIIPPPGDSLPRVTIALRRRPAVKVLEATVEVLGQKLERPRPGTYYVLAPGQALPDPPALDQDPKADIDLIEVPASVAVALLSTLTPVPAVFPCGAGDPTTLRLRRVPISEVLVALSHLTGQAINADAPATTACPQAIWDGHDPVPAGARLRAIAVAGTKRAALVEWSSGQLRVIPQQVPGHEVVVGVGYLAIDNRDLPLTRDEGETWPSQSPLSPVRDDGGRLDEGARLTATLVSKDKSWALLQWRDGTHLWIEHWVGLEHPTLVEPGLVEFSVERAEEIRDYRALLGSIPRDVTGEPPR